MYKIESEFYSLLGSISSSLTQNEIFLKKLSKCDWNNWLMRDILHFGKYAISYSFALLLFKPSNKLLCIITTQIMVLIDLNLSNSDTTNTHIDKNHGEKKNCLQSHTGIGAELNFVKSICNLVQWKRAILFMMVNPLERNKIIQWQKKKGFDGIACDSGSLLFIFPPLLPSLSLWSKQNITMSATAFVPIVRFLTKDLRSS